MNWEAIGAVGEILGAMAVIGSLLFVGMQIRNNTRATQVASSHNLTNTFLTVLNSLATDPELTRIWLQQSRDISALSGNDLQRVLSLNVMVLKAFEDAFHHHRLGQMSDEMWDGWQAFILLVCSYPGVRQYWEQRKNFYSRSFQEYVDNPPPIDEILSTPDFIASITGHEES